MAGRITANQLTLGDSGTAANNFELRTSADGTAKLARGATGTLGDILSVDASGNVGIGTSSPTAKLDVTGAIKSSSSITSGSDFIGSGASGYAALYGNATGGLVVCRGSSSTNDIEFYTNNSERMRIDSSGNLLVGTTSNQPGGASYPGQITVFSAGGTSKTGINVTTTSSAASKMIEFQYTGFGVAGVITTTTNATAYTTSSDYRLKDNVTSMTGALDKVAQLNPVTWNWKFDGVASQGFIAHELQAVVPECVIGTKDEVDENGKPIYQTVDTSFLVATLTAAIQEQQALIQDLTTRLAALEAK